MKKLLFLSLLCLITEVNAQQLQVEMLSSEAFRAESFLGTDKFGYRYGIRDNVFFKFQNNEFVEYKNLSLGKIVRVDLQNPLRIILFYENFNTIVMLDNQLNEIQKINFSDNPVQLVVSATGMASRNRVWIYNSLSQQIGLYDYLNNKYASLTQSLRGILKHYESDFNYFQWIDDKYNWYACDIFGKITNLGRVPEFDSIQIINSQLLLFSKNGIIHLSDLKNDKTFTVENVEKTFKSFSYKDQILSIFTSEGITNYKITLP